MYLGFGQAFASQDIIVAVADYGLRPQVRYSTFIQDGPNAFANVHDHIAQYGGDPDRVFVAGHFAGVHIAVMLAADRQYLHDARANAAWIHGVIGIDGPFNFPPLTDKDLIALFGGNNRLDTQPIKYIDGKRPPILLAYGTADTTVGSHNTTYLAAKLKMFGSPVGSTAIAASVTAE